MNHKQATERWESMSPEERRAMAETAPVVLYVYRHRFKDTPVSTSFIQWELDFGMSVPGEWGNESDSYLDIDGETCSSWSHAFEQSKLKLEQRGFIVSDEPMTQTLRQRQIAQGRRK